MARGWLVKAAALLMLAALPACTAHPVGPTRSFSKYEGKAVTTAEAALSSVETVRLVARTASRGDAFGPYLSVTASDQEEALSGVQGTFASIQPPNTTATNLRSELNDLLGTALDEVTDVRIVLRRGQLGRAAATAAPLKKTSAQLQDFIEAHK